MSGRGAMTAGDLLTLPELRGLRRTSTLRGAGLVVHAWAVIVGAMLLYAAWPSVLTLLVAVAVIAGAMAEHALAPDVDDPLRNTRATRARFLERARVAPYWMNYHLEHHLLVFVPCWRLPDARALLLAKGHGPSMEVAPGHLDVIRRATTVRSAS